MSADSRPLVLICDDEPVLRELIRVSLGPEYRYTEAASVSEAIDAYAAHLPDLVVLDLMLVGGSGLDVLRSIRQGTEAPGTPVVVVSAWTDEANRQAVEAEGADLFLPKPFAPEQLVGRVEELVGAARGRPPGA